MEQALPLLRLPHADGLAKGLVAGTYLHGLLDTPEVQDALVAALRERKGLPAAQRASGGARLSREAGYEAAADVLEAHLNLEGLLPR